MGQVNAGLVRVANGSATVSHVWTVTLETVSGTFSQGLVIDWDGGSGSTGGDGVVTSWNSSLNRLRFYRTAGVAPTSGEAIRVVAATSNNGTISALAATSPPDWSTNPTITASGSKTVVFSKSATGNYTLASSGHTSDTFAMTANFTGTELVETGYGIHADFTPNIGLPTIEYGDVDAVGLVTKGLTEIDRRLYFRGSMLSMTSDQVISATTNTIAVFGTETYNIGGWVGTSGDGFFTVPSGVTHVRAAFSVLPLNTVANTLNAQIWKNGDGDFPGFVLQSAATMTTGVPHSQVSPVLAVAAGDTLKLNLYLGAGNTIDAHFWTWFAVEAVELGPAT